MKKNKLALLSITAALLLAGCSHGNGGNTSSQTTTPEESQSETQTTTKPETSNGESSNSSETTTPESETTQGSTTESKPTIDETITLFMFGDIYMNGYRTIYATLENKTDSEFVWESSNPKVATVSPRTGLSSEGNVMAVGYGTTTITCSLEDYPEIKASKEITIAEGEAMPEELYNSITGSMKVSSEQYYYSYDANFWKSKDDLTVMETVYEEYKDNSDDVKQSTDGYHFSETKKNQVVKDFTYVRSNNNDVAVEGRDIYNRIVYKNVLNSEGKSSKWATTAYSNMFAFDDIVTRNEFRTFDGGKTYHYTGFEPQTRPLMNSLYLTSISPDDLYFSVLDDGSLTLTTVTDPYAEATMVTRYSTEIVSKFSELGTAKVNHSSLFEHFDYHDAIQKAVDEVKASKNYTVDVTYDKPVIGGDIFYNIKRNENTIHKIKSNESGVVGQGGQRLVGKLEENKYYTYNLNEAGVPVKSANKEGKFEDLLPNFYFAPEILTKVGDNAFETIDNMGFFVTKIAPLTGEYNFYQWLDKGTLTLTADGKLDTVATIATDGEGNTVKISAKFSNIGTTKIDLDFTSIEGAPAPTTWEEAYPVLAEELRKWNLLDVIPFVENNVGWDESVSSAKADSGKPAYAFFTSRDQKSQEDNDAWIAKFIEALLADGYTLQGDKDPEFGYDLYVKGQYKIGVGYAFRKAWLPTMKPTTFPEKSTIVVRSPLLEFPTAE